MASSIRGFGWQSIIVGGTDASDAHIGAKIRASSFPRTHTGDHAVPIYLAISAVMVLVGIVTSEGAIAVVKKEAYAVPQRLLSDNGAALNPSRRGVLGQLVAYVTSLGVEPITGKPYKPTTQGKNERFHQTRFPIPRQTTPDRDARAVAVAVAGARRPVRPHL